ncbi:uncharacterized protein PFL1_00870 [Pseudozyma flocculosa PF-1]|uniref:JmjC domain-containing protein n=1 Tax=Pseudozyma flocculosa TaxID=84751 RepID=A0A5C3F3W6_9BASI|nr:uncharacterized protein PFL1_00870 [Pseudozyma flocculosa PF-1]EPQ31537.1 hypothetical protein PFL1_00870 [Pseudozyma flocculosa PF-1]SPO38675.1 uncharacterized protein PSFLO_04154 [Pseudozyma flocculosa]
MSAPILDLAPADAAPQPPAASYPATKPETDDDAFATESMHASEEEVIPVPIHGRVVKAEQAISLPPLASTPPHQATEPVEHPTLMEADQGPPPKDVVYQAPTQRKAAMAAQGRMEEMREAVDPKRGRVASSSTPKRPASSVPKLSLDELVKQHQFEHGGQLWELQFRSCQAPSSDASTLAHFVSSRNPDRELQVPDSGSFNRSIDDDTCTRLQRTTAKSLLPILRREAAHARLPEALRRQRETEYRQMCEFCNTSIFSASWFCRCCGREYCPDCQEALRDPDTAQDASPKERLRLTICSRGRVHTADDLIPMTRFDIEMLDEEIAVMERLGLQEDDLWGESRGWDSDAEPNFNGRNHVSKHEPIDWPTLPPYRAGLEADRLVGFRSLRQFDRHQMSNRLMEREWRHGEPLLVTGIRDMRHFWDPPAFVERYGQDACHIVRCDKDPELGKRDDGITALTDVKTFFRTFGTSAEERKEMLGEGSWKLKDWPPSADFKETFPELYDDFNRAVPVPDYTRRDGVLNLGSYYPRNVIQPDLGPKMYNAWPSDEGPGSRGTTRLHMDMADAVNIMLHASPPKGVDVPEELRPGVAAWDIFPAEDADTIREFLRKEFDPNGAFKDDPIHTQRYFIDAERRVKLFREYGVQGWRIYQKVGEAVFIPAGCAHQVCNLADCIKVAVDFVSPQNIERCFKLTSEFRQLTKDFRAWKEDVLSLRTTLWYAWCACRQFQNAGPYVADAAKKDRPPGELKMVLQTIPASPSEAAGPSSPLHPARSQGKKREKDSGQASPAQAQAGHASDADELERPAKKARSTPQAKKKAAKTSTPAGKKKMSSSGTSSSRSKKAAVVAPLSDDDSELSEESGSDYDDGGFDSSKATPSNGIASRAKVRASANANDAAGPVEPALEIEPNMPGDRSVDFWRFLDKRMSNDSLYSLAHFCHNLYRQRGLEMPTTFD